MSLKGKPKPQGKLNAKIVLMGILGNKKKKDIAVEAGSIASSDSARIQTVNNVMNSNKYKKMSNTLIDKLQKEIDRLIDSMLLVKHESIEYRDMASAIDKLIKNKELLSGGATERKEVNTDEVKEFLNRS